MTTDSPCAYHFRVLLVAFVTLALAVVGCGPAEETTEEGEEWEQTPTVSPTARMEYQVDSLTNETRRLQEQVDAVATENRNLRARVAELETKITEQAAAQISAPAPAVASGESRSGYTGALDLFMARNYQQAITEFEGLLSAGISDDLADNCHYWIGESYYAMGKYSEAIGHFEKVFDFPQSGKRPYAQLMIGNAQAALGNTSAAKEAYNALVTTYPASHLVSKAQDKLAKLR